MSGEGSTLAAGPKARPAHRGRDYCIFTCSGRDFAVSVSAAREVLSGEPATPVPQAAAALVGVINLRGEVLPLVQLDSLLGMPTRPYTAGNQIVVVSADEVDIGLVVDRVRELRSIDANEIIACAGGDAGHRLCCGEWRSPTGPVAVLDAEKVVTEAIGTVSVRFRQRLTGLGGDSRRSAGTFVPSDA